MWGAGGYYFVELRVNGMVGETLFGNRNRDKGKGTNERVDWLQSETGRGDEVWISWILGRR